MSSQAGKPGETGADALCDTLLANGVDVCFANPGTSEMHFVAALDRKQQMRCVLGLFEGVVTGAADGYARMAEKPAATLLHTGPGLANALANMHNARRANTPMVNVVGDHASYHLPYDAPLTSDIESLARPMSGHVRRIGSAADVSAATAESIAAASRAPGLVSTLILPADHAWEAAPQVPPVKADLRAPTAADPTRITAAAKALKNGKKTVVLISGTGLRAQALESAQAIADTTGATIMAQQSNGRIERGAGRVQINRVPYPVDQAIEALKGFEQIILVGAKFPVVFFGYPGKPSSPVPADCVSLTLADPSDDLPAALEVLAGELGASAPKITAAPAIPDLMSGALSPESIAVTLGHGLPENAIICDESVTSGRDFFRFTFDAAPHDWLQVTGGAIGGGMPLAVGAALACPDRKVVNLQADGSAMYTNQALWTMARENLDVCVVIFSNRKYQILLGELKGVGAGEPGKNASRMLNLDEPALDWVKIAEGMGVEAARADTAEGFTQLFDRATKTKGPFLIEALI
ncbi:acetolactate synthase large subunit [Pseudooceanicola onchidii]|uniref:acetolactate synthase large subunit n=1 Tax=Pseudooceanicola onchidii TaxID=2562279 RepID=UPI0010A9E9DF|nr:acetolactate synthase large subunit [Pseudooceanicola onchidii]